MPVLVPWAAGLLGTSLFEARMLCAFRQRSRRAEMEASQNQALPHDLRLFLEWVQPHPCLQSLETNVSETQVPSIWSNAQLLSLHSF